MGFQGEYRKRIPNTEYRYGYMEMDRIRATQDHLATTLLALDAHALLATYLPGGGGELVGPWNLSHWMHMLC